MHADDISLPGCPVAIQQYGGQEPPLLADWKTTESANIPWRPIAIVSNANLWKRSPAVNLLLPPRPLPRRPAEESKWRMSSEKALFRACRLGQVPNLHHALQGKTEEGLAMSANIVDAATGQTPVHVAARSGHAAVILELIALKASVSTPTSDGVCVCVCVCVLPHTSKTDSGA